MRLKSLVVLGVIGVLALAGCGAQKDAPAPAAAPTSEVASSQCSAPAAAQGTELADPQVAVDAFQKEWPKATLTQLSYNKEMTGEIYKASGCEADQELEIAVDAKTGKVLDKKTEKENDIEQKEAIKLSDAMKPADAIAKALKESKLAKPEAGDWTLELETGRLVYDIDVKDGAQDVSVLLDAKTGELIELDN